VGGRRTTRSDDKLGIGFLPQKSLFQDFYVPGLTFKIDNMLSCSVTRRLIEKCAQFCPNIGLNGALVNKKFCPKKYPVKMRKFEVKK
jgi:hypothetical protein